MFKQNKSLSDIENDMVFVSHVSALEQKEIERIFVRLFSSDDGKKALAYLQCMTFQRAMSPSSSDASLRYAEGQRAMIATILRLIDRGRNA